jgi:cytochrome c-type biogenesis protein
MSVGVSAGAAFLGGLASFLSPCVLPLVPGYLSFISGLSLEELSEDSGSEPSRRKTVLGSVFFVLGFSVVFTALGASASALGRLLAVSLPILSRIAGALIVLFGLHTMGLLPIRWLYYEKRVPLRGITPGHLGAFLMGLAFACGWTPCIGPILASILALAATQETVTHGVFLLGIYSLGLGLPFVLTALGVNAFLRLFARYKPYLRWGEILCGIMLVLVGLLVATNRLAWLITLIPPFFFRFSL